MQSGARLHVALVVLVIILIHSAVAGRLSLRRETARRDVDVSSEAPVCDCCESCPKKSAVEQRIDPADGEAYTWEEYSAYYKKTYDKKQLEAYWESMKIKKEKCSCGGKKGTAAAPIAPVVPPAPAPAAPAPAPASGPCVPQCKWKCESPKCDQVCTPECQQPRCQTRCAKRDTSRCTEKCDEPLCMVVCPERFCSGRNCPACTTKCAQPQCRLECKEPQPCTNVCEQPLCSWNCKEPDHCPAPKCSLICDPPKACNATTFSAELPKLEDGDIVVGSFAAGMPARSGRI
eukprot:gnl/TRDRNA2_/TRDRNA2_176210_c0_seq3.p1 gnl/TRDRNA2_/TRDRNA2_176210_c0~~gnl/TRDRNA2_/TRDRNA2_176210_c0_seq3.p1  ORF type:complete len:289 (+),score=44.91 gnl/TRDRNA2_/TRDRNA2_176210_c0_seq3:114-980(+)